MKCPNCKNEIEDNSKFCKYCGHKIQESKSYSNISEIGSEIGENDLDNYLKKEVDNIVDRLLESNYENFIKQWINFATMAIFNNFKNIWDLKNKNQLDSQCIEAMMKPTHESIQSYLKIFLIHFLVVCVNNKHEIKSLENQGISFDKFKNSIFDFFGFDNNWEKAYGSCLNNYENPINYSNILIEKYIMYGFGKTSKEIDLATSLMFRDGLSSAKSMLNEYFENLYKQI
jgi:hypothetical protein